MRNIIIIFAVLCVIALSGCAQTGIGRDNTACTADAKLCPDGSAVGRTGPDCEFAPCPADGQADNDGQTIGGQKDEGGCLIGAGYSWCEAKQKCIRQWEEPCAKPEVSMCNTDSDCIPLPSECHPRICINKRFGGDYVKPEMCTMMFDVQAAYEPKDCACVDNLCVNKNIGNGDPSAKIGADSVIDSYESCVAAGGPIMESYPRQCSYEGKTFTEEISSDLAGGTRPEGTECTCPEGYRKDGEACNPECYYSEPACMMPSVICE